MYLVNKYLRRPPRGGRGLKSVSGLAPAQNISGRPPRGGRGLKFLSLYLLLIGLQVAPLAGGVD